MKPFSPFVAALAASSLLVVSSSALAHHAFNAEFDRNAPVVLTGTITSLNWVTPHTEINLTAREGDKAPRRWMVIGGTPNTLLRMGLTRDMLKPGTEVTIRGYQTLDKACTVARGYGPTAPSYPDSCKAIGFKVIYPDGRSIAIGPSGPSAPPQP